MIKMNKPNIYCVGGANIDYKLTSLVDLKTKTSNPISTSIAYGGVARNVANNLACWTSGVYLQTVVGNDNEGQELLEHLKQLGVNTKASLIINDHSTSRYYAVLDIDGELHMGFASMAIYDNIPVESFTAIWNDWHNSIIFADTNLPSHLLNKLIYTCKINNNQLVIDPVSDEKGKRLPGDLNGVFLIKPNLSEASVLTEMTIHSLPDGVKAGKKLIERGVQYVVLSLSELGYLVISQDFDQYIPVKKINRVIDVSGAGDAFVSGILYGLQQGLTVMAACELGEVVATKTIQSLKTVIDTDEIFAVTLANT